MNRHHILTGLRFLLLLTFAISSCKVTNHLADTRTKTLRINNIPPDTTLQILTGPYRITMDDKMNEVLTECPELLSKSKPESTLTNWVADAIYDQSIKYFTEDIAFAYQNYGGIRIPTIGKGPVTLGKIFELMPFDNILVLVKIKGDELLKFGQYLADIEGGPISSSLKLTISNKKLESMTVHGQPVDESKYYFIAMPDYIANGGDNQSYLIDNERVDKGIFLRDVLIAEAKSQSEMKSSLDQRIIIKP